jgi:hypothetical protein
MLVGDARGAGNHRCSADVRVGRPGSKADVLAMVRRFNRVKAVGNGHRRAVLGRTFTCFLLYIGTVVGWLQYILQQEMID